MTGDETLAAELARLIVQALPVVRTLLRGWREAAPPVLKPPPAPPDAAAPTPAPVRHEPRKFTPERVVALRAMCVAGVSNKEINARLNQMPGPQLGPRAVMDFLKKEKAQAAAERPSEGRRLNGVPRFSPARVERLLTMRAAGETNAAILTALQAMDGLPLGRRAVIDWLTRHRDLPPRPKAAAARPPAPSPSPPSSPPAPPVYKPPPTRSPAPPTRSPSPAVAGVHRALTAAEVVARRLPAGTRVVDREQLRTFVASKGWQIDPADLAEVNARCRRLGIQPFALRA